MAGNYLKSLQLAKQLEGRAKEAAKNKKLAEAERESLQEFLDLCKASDVDISDIDKTLSEFAASIDGRDYQAAIGHSTKAREMAKNAYIHKIADVADSVDALLKLTVGAEGEAKGAKEILERSKELVVKDDLEGAMKKAKSAYDAGERAFHEHFSALFSQAQGVVNQAKDMGDDVSLYEDLLARSKSALEKQDYETSMSQLKEALEGAGENLKSQIEETITRADDIVRTGEDIEAETERVTKHIERARSALESLRYKDALSYSKRAEGEADKVISSSLNDMIREIRNSIKSMKTDDEESHESRQLLDQAQEAVKEKRYNDAIKSYNEAKGKNHAIQFQGVLRVITKAKDKFVLAKKVGVDMSDALRLLNVSREALRNGKFEEAIGLAEQSEDAVEIALQLFYKARDGLVELAKSIKLAKDLDLDISQPKSHLADAKKAFETRDYEKAGKATSEGVSMARKMAYDVARVKIDDADRAVKLAIRIGAEVIEAEETLEKATISMSGENLSETISLIDASLNAASSALSRALTDKLNSIDDFVSGITGFDDSLTEVKGSIENARNLIAEKEFERTNVIIVEITAGLEDLGRQECERMAGVSRDRLQMAASMGIDTSDLEVLKTRAGELLEKESYHESLSRMREVVQNADEEMFRALQADFSAIKDALEDAKTLTIDISNAKDRLKDARKKAEAGEFQEAFDLAASTKEQIRDSIAKYDTIKEKARKAEELINEAGESRIDVSSLTRRLNEARDIFLEGKLDAADDILERLINETEKRLAMYLAAKFILVSKENIDLAEAHGITIDEAQELLSKAKEQMKQKDYDEALELSKKASETAKVSLTAGVEEMIRNVQRIVTDAKNVSIDTVGPDKLVEKATELSSKAEFSEALKCLDLAKEDIDHVRNLSSQAAGEIKSARSRLKDAETFNMSVDQARELLDQSVEAMTRHQYAIALELAKKSAEMSLEVTRTTIWNTLERFKARVEETIAEGMHVGIAERYVAEGIDAFNNGKYHDSLTLARQCEAEMERAELQKDISAQAVESAMKKLADAAAEGIRVDAAAEIADRAEAFLKQGKYTDALSTAIESGDALHEIRENLDSARIAFSATREQVERLKKVNIDTSSCDEIIDMAHEYLSVHDFDKFRDALARCSKKVGTLFETSVSDLMDETKEIISKAKAMGIDTKDCENLLEVAGTSFSEKLWDFSYQQAESCRGKCIDLVEKKISNLVQETEDRLETLGHVGAGVKSIRKLIDEARTSIDSGDHMRAFDILMKADQKVQTIEDSNWKYLDISIAAESAIENLRRLGGSVKEAERLLDLADLEKEKDYDSAIELVAEALDTAHTQTESYAADISGVITTDGLYSGTESEIVVTLRNSGKAAARSVKVELSGEFDLKDVQSIDLLEPGKEERVVARIVPRDEGDLSIRANISARRRFDSTVDDFEIEGRLKVYSSGPPFKIARATGVSKCALCQGKVKSGFDIVSCRCGSDLHLACAKRAGRCPACGQGFEF
ncbi:MAG: CARDB domain-containing protein [Thermoplasmata archaeon]